MTAKHTPGPWNVERDQDGDLIVAQPGHDGQVIVVLRGADGPEWEANARLIAAAPELLESGRRVLSILDAVRYTVGLTGSQVERMDKLRAAIRKAEGA